MANGLPDVFEVERTSHQTVPLIYYASGERIGRVGLARNSFQPHLAVEYFFGFKKLTKNCTSGSIMDQVLRKEPRVDSLSVKAMYLMSLRSGHHD